MSSYICPKDIFFNTGEKATVNILSFSVTEDRMKMEKLLNIAEFNYSFTFREKQVPPGMTLSDVYEKALLDEPGEKDSLWIIFARNGDKWGKWGEWTSDRLPIPAHFVLIADSEEDVPPIFSNRVFPLEVVANWFIETWNQRSQVLYGREEIDRLKNEKVRLVNELQRKKSDNVTNLSGENEKCRFQKQKRVMVLWIMAFACISICLGSWLIFDTFGVSKILELFRFN